jgi:hypothetical protein
MAFRFEDGSMRRLATMTNTASANDGERLAFPIREKCS